MQSHPNSEDWRSLAELTMSRLIIFNARRQAEVSNLEVSDYLQRPQWNEASAGELDMALSPTDRILAGRYSLKKCLFKLFW